MGACICRPLLFNPTCAGGAQFTDEGAWTRCEILRSWVFVARYFSRGSVVQVARPQASDGVTGHIIQNRRALLVCCYRSDLPQRASTAALGLSLVPAARSVGGAPRSAWAMAGLGDSFLHATTMRDARGDAFPPTSAVRRRRRTWACGRLAALTPSANSHRWPAIHWSKDDR
jgi:hypothetical protein